MKLLSLLAGALNLALVLAWRFGRQRQTRWRWLFHGTGLLGLLYGCLAVLWVIFGFEAIALVYLTLAWGMGWVWKRQSRDIKE